jgi:NADPH:quinone reductase-like Zn-dependent oxidoreductase
VRVPAGLDLAEAALLPCAGITAGSGPGPGERMVAGKSVVLLMGKCWSLAFLKAPLIIALNG